MNRPQLAGLTIKLELVQARDLIAMDPSNLLGQPATSNTYDIKV